MPNKHGDFIWYELLTSDADAAQDFYGDVVSWNITPGDSDETDYRMLTASDGDSVGGLMAITDEMKGGGARPTWLGYIAVDDVDAEVKQIIDAGGAVHMPATTMEGVGRMAMVADPQGAMFYVMKPTPPADDPHATSTAFAAHEPMEGHCAWNELLTSDPEAAKCFYGDRFGWTKCAEMDMGEMGKYEMLQQSDYTLGAVMAKPERMPVSSWVYYFRVPNIDAAIEKAKAKGGKIMVGPQEIPGGEFTVDGLDPQGAMFALIGPKQES